MARHHLIERAKPSDLVQVVSDLAGVHAQVKSSAEFSLWARTDALQRDAVDEALWTNRTLVKLWAMRGTLYLLPSAELGLWLSALGTYTKFGNVGHPQIDVLADAVGRALTDRILTREELADVVTDLTGSTSLGESVRFSWGSYLKAASFRGLICFAPSEGARVRFTNPASWIPYAIDRPDPEQAVVNITRRFLSAYAPVTAESLTRWWLGPPMPRRGERMHSALGEEAVDIDVEGQLAKVLARDVRDMQSTDMPNIARLLPAFDPWVTGMSRSAPFLEPQHQSRVFRKQGWISPVLLVNGRIAGVWGYERRGRRLIVEIEPFGTLPVWAEAQIEAEAERLAAFFDCRLELHLHR
jgi:hypothetical protein